MSDWLDELSKDWTPKQRRNSDRRVKAIHFEMSLYRLIPWMSWPILRYIYSFWYNIMDEGIIATCKPRWGHVTFGWLNDGFKPTVWHTWRQLTHSSITDKYTGIYPEGAPKSKKQADEWEDKWAKEAEEKAYKESVFV
jgi:hypothetical protein